MVEVDRAVTSRRTDPDVLAFVRELASKGYAPRRIFDRLGQTDRFSGRTPSLRTLYALIGEMTPTPGPGWRMAAADPDDAALILPVLGAVTRNSDGRIGHFTDATAGWIARIRRVAPMLEPIAAYRWAVRYQTATAAGRDTGELDRELSRDMEKPPRQDGT